jgi:hypothetical protein
VNSTAATTPAANTSVRNRASSVYVRSIVRLEVREAALRLRRECYLVDDHRFVLECNSESRGDAEKTGGRGGLPTGVILSRRRRISSGWRYTAAYLP